MQARPEICTTAINAPFLTGRPDAVAGDDYATVLMDCHLPMVELPINPAQER